MFSADLSRSKNRIRRSPSGGNGNACFKRVVGLADGWQVVTQSPDDTFSTGNNLAQSLEILKRMSGEADRDFQTIETNAVVIKGTANEVLKDIEQYQKARCESPYPGLSVVRIRAPRDGRYPVWRSLRARTWKPTSPRCFDRLSFGKLFLQSWLESE